MLIFPTKGKSKLPQFMSYPVGAKIISAALQDVPQADLLSIDFSFINSAKAHYQHEVPYPIFEAQRRYWHPSHGTPNQWIEQGMYEPKWLLRVRAVPRPFLNQWFGQF